jgi:pimeloyl-ACP methyl ester carboxylesterase
MAPATTLASESAPLPPLPTGVSVNEIIVVPSEGRIAPSSEHSGPNRPIRLAGTLYVSTLADSDAWGVIIQHATGVPQSTYFPLVHYLFETVGPKKIRQIALHDVRNHGDSAVLNAGLLPVGEKLVKDGWNWPQDSLVDAIGFIRALGLDKTRLLGIGHSFGGALLSMVQLEANHVFQTLVLVEPILFGRYPPIGQPGTSPKPPNASSPATQAPAIPKGIMNAGARRSVFPSKEFAKSNYATRAFFKSWHPACLDLYIEHGLRQLDSGEWELKTTPEQEAATFKGGGDRIVPYWKRLPEIKCPVLVVSGRASHHVGMRFEGKGGKVMWVFDLSWTTPALGELNLDIKPTGSKTKPSRASPTENTRGSTQATWSSRTFQKASRRKSPGSSRGWTPRPRCDRGTRFVIVKCLDEEYELRVRFSMRATDGQLASTLKCPSPIR